MSNPSGLWYPKQAPLQGLSGLWGGVSSNLTGGASVVVDPINAIPNGVGGQLLFGGYGFEAWSNPVNNFSWGYSPNSENSGSRHNYGASTPFNFTVPALVEKIRVVLIGGGGGSSGQHNVQTGEGGGGYEGFIPVTAGETLTMFVGQGGGGRYSGPDGQPGDGGPSSLFRNPVSTTVPVIQARGGTGTEWTGTRQNGTFRAGGVNPGPPGSYSMISIGEGGAATGQGQATQTSSALLNGGDSTLEGATWHGGGAGSGQGGSGISEGSGFGGGGGRWQTSGTLGQGGTYGFEGNGGGGSGTTKGNSGPVRGFGNPEGKWDNASPFGATVGGGGGGSYGGAGNDGWSGGFGAGGLVRVWWADSNGDPNWIETGGNYQ